jgi:hypothetical protein
VLLIEQTELTGTSYCLYSVRDNKFGKNLADVTLDGCDRDGQALCNLLLYTYLISDKTQKASLCEGITSSEQAQDVLFLQVPRQVANKRWLVGASVGHQE